MQLSHAEEVQIKDAKRAETLTEKQKDKPLVNHIFTADPSAHVFEGKIYVYPSHDIEQDSGPSVNDDGDQYAMRDYHVLSLSEDLQKATDHGVALSLEDIPWASEQLWAPDAAKKGDTYYFYFPARDRNGLFRIGVATSSTPTGPFKAENSYIEGTFSIDPAVFEDDDGSYYLYFGGLWGGQLEHWENNRYSTDAANREASAPAFCPRVAKLSKDMLSLETTPKEILIRDEHGELIAAGDNHRRFFEAAWLHKHNDVYYFSYSTGDTHKIVYATGNSPFGPFTYQGTLLEPVLGWTNHHSIVSYNDKWYLFYHDSTLSKGQSHLRSVKMAEIIHDDNGKIVTYNAYKE